MTDDDPRNTLAACAAALGGVLDYDHLVEEVRRLASERDDTVDDHFSRCSLCAKLRKARLKKVEP